jgi:thiol-disulfide isomerase/thioredoxin
MQKLSSICLLLTLCCYACDVPQSFNAMAPGIWRGVLYLEGKEQTKMKTVHSDEILTDPTEAELPFNFEVKYEGDKMYWEIINDTERIRVDDIQCKLDRRTQQDTLRATLPFFNTYISAVREDRILEGWWYVPSKPNYRIKFVAKQADNFRFAQLPRPAMTNVTGKWAVVFGEGDSQEKAVGEFKQNGTHLSGTFLTETGDYRYLEGMMRRAKRTTQGNTIEYDQLLLSCFDGSHAFLFTAKLMPDGTLAGDFRSGSHYKTVWVAKKDDSAHLRSADSLTFLKAGFSSINFRFPDTENKMVSLDNPEYKGKVKIVQILGTWCPNCLDESRFLVSYLKQHPNNNLAVIGLGYEKTNQLSQQQSSLKAYKSRLSINYPLLAAGYAHKDSAAASLPMLNHIMSFPTTIFIDKNNKVRRIVTGFSGPATSEFEAYQKDFDIFVKKLLLE